MWKISSPLERWKCTETDCILFISRSVKEFAMSLSVLVKVQHTFRAKNQTWLLKGDEMGEFISAEAAESCSQKWLLSEFPEFFSVCNLLAGFICCLCVRIGFLQWSERHIDPLNSTNTAFTLIFQRKTS